MVLLQSKMPVTLLIPESTRKRLERYMQELVAEEAMPGEYLKRKLQHRPLHETGADSLLESLIATKIPCIFAESEIAGDGSDWNLCELGLLGDLSMAVDVQVFDNGHHTSPEVHQKPFDGTLIFTPGALLRNGKGLPPADWAEVTTSSGALDAEGFYALYQRRLLPVFEYIEQRSAVSGKPAFLTIPGLGCGQFAGPFRGRLGMALKEVLERFLETYGKSFPNLKAVYYDPYNECGNERHTINGIAFMVRPLMQGNAGKPQLCTPTAYEEAGDDFASCHLYSIVAWDHVSWPGNDYYAGSRVTDDGVKAAATSTMREVTGITGKYDPSRNAYIPPAPFRNWGEVASEKTIAYVNNRMSPARRFIESHVDNTLGRHWYEMLQGKTRLVKICKYLIRRPIEVYLCAKPHAFVLEQDDWVSDVAKSADFSKLPENPTIAELNRFALMIDGYSMIDHLERLLNPKTEDSVQDFVDRALNPGLVAARQGLDLWRGDALDLWCCLFMVQRSFWKEGYKSITDDSPYISKKDCAADDGASRGIWPALRKALQREVPNPPQEELQQQPEFIPYRPATDPREIKLQLPAFESANFTSYVKKVLNAIYEEAWEKGLINESSNPSRRLPYIDVSSVMPSTRETASSNYGCIVNLADAEILIASEGDFGDDVEADLPYLVTPGWDFRVPEKFRIPFIAFNYQRELEKGTFSTEAGEKFLRGTDAFDYVDVDRAEAKNRFLRELPNLVNDHIIRDLGIDFVTAPSRPNPS